MTGRDNYADHLLSEVAALTATVNRQAAALRLAAETLTTRGLTVPPLVAQLTQEADR